MRSLLVHFFQSLEGLGSCGKHDCCLGQCRSRQERVRLCWMRLPYRRRHHGQTTRRRHDFKAVMRTTAAALLQVRCGASSALCQRSGRRGVLKRALIPRERLSCWSEHSGRVQVPHGPSSLQEICRSSIRPTRYSWSMKQSKCGASITVMCMFWLCRNEGIGIV